MNDWSEQYRICCELHNKEKALEIWHEWLRERTKLREVVIPMPLPEPDKKATIVQSAYAKARYEDLCRWKKHVSACAANES